MFGDVPDPTVMTIRVGSGTAFRTRARGGFDALSREGFGPCGRIGQKDRLYCRYSYPLGRQTDSECDETWQAAYLHYNNTACQLSTHSENIFRPLIK